ncbi:hypothetical protein IEQ34_004201 [Dendrobium chrysotoxum]|uniref:Uncharacterized protein n=1 Tax=Dendrobium chrysotoxum TaxID=161865 RepID=A0AAV7HFY8_DENCH|nr:hypothetical protein IEQ34_004201 [Dendrobium chrysotoxum]
MDMAENVDTIHDGKKNNHKLLSNTQCGITKLKNPPKCKPKGITNVTLKGYWEKKRKPKSKFFGPPCTQCIQDCT